jgi:hypothetical protein
MLSHVFISLNGLPDALMDGSSGIIIVDYFVNFVSFKDKYK